MISMVGWVAFLGCNTEAGTRGAYDKTAPGTNTASATEKKDLNLSSKPSKAGENAKKVEFGAYDQWDADNSGDISKNEFDTHFASFQGWADWDKNGDQSLDKSEASGAQFAMWDRNGDGELSKDEWGDGVDAADIKSDWKDADTDNDGKLSSTEFTQWFSGKMWDEWDKDHDGKVAKNEAANALWNLWDKDNDNKIEKGEFNDAMKA
jgi:Ca2+-binding EF-hand superfamily protein